MNIEKTATPKNYGEYKKLVFAFLLLAISVGVVVLVAYPFYNNYQNTSVLLEAETKKIQDLDTRLSQLDKVKRLAGAIESNTKLTTEAVSIEDDIPVVMAMVQEIAKDSGVKISDFSYAGSFSTKPVAVSSTPSTVSPTPSTEETKTVNDNFKMNLSVKGKFSDIKQFILNVENSRRILDIDSFSYSLQNSETEIVGDVITLKVFLVSYFKNFSPLTVTINLDQYSPTIKKLESLKYTYIDLSNPNVGKIDPFSSLVTPGISPSPRPSGTPVPINNIETESFFNGSNNNDSINIVELEGTGKSATVEEDVEAEEGDTTKLLQDLLRQEGL